MALVIKSWSVKSHPGAGEPYVKVVARESGFWNFIFSLLGIDATTTFQVTGSRIEFEQGSLSGFIRRLTTFEHICSTFYGRFKPWKSALGIFGFCLFLGSAMQSGWALFAFFVLGAVIFLAALVAAAAYIMQLPVKGLLATSGVVAIVVGLALQSTLSDVFSGIVLNTTKPYRLDDWVSIDGTEGKVIEMDWRATHLRTSQGGTVVIPNSVAAKAKILNLNRTADIHQLSISVSVPAQVRPRLVFDALNRTLQGVSALLPAPKAKVTVKASDLHTVEYEISGYVSAQCNKTEVRNLMFDLAHRHLQAAGILRGNEPQEVAHSPQRALLDDVKIFRSLSADDKDRLAEQMQPLAVSAGQVVLELGEVSEQLLVIGTGVVSAAVPDGERFVEAGRMGPGEIMGEQGIIHDTPSQARFTALSSGMLYRIDKSLIQASLEQHSEIGSALQKLQSFREQSSASLLVQKPATIKKGGFLSWLQRS